jgi:predicted amino acid-binding ACT domain protein
MAKYSKNGTRSLANSTAHLIEHLSQSLTGIVHFSKALANRQINVLNIVSSLENDYLFLFTLFNISVVINGLQE